MPLRDHFRSPLDDRTSWESFHGAWPAVMVWTLNARLPRRFIAELRIHFGASVEIDVATLEKDELGPFVPGASEEGGAIATAVWAPPRPTFGVTTDLPDQDEYEVRIHDTRRQRRLVAAVEIVSPANKDRPEHRRAFVTKCAALLQQRVSVAIVDLVTTRQFNLYEQLLESIGHTDPSLGPEPPHIYAAASRWTLQGGNGHLDVWAHPLILGQPLPTLPLWLAENYAVPLDLEATYEETCRGLRIA